MSLDLKVNGELRSVPGVPDPTTLCVVLSALSVRKELVAIALNDLIVPRARWKDTLVSAGDRLEIVHFVGGGSGLKIDKPLCWRTGNSPHGDLSA